MASLLIVAQDKVAEPLLAKVPAGVFVHSSIAVGDADLARISRSLGGDLRRVTNSTLSVHGASIRFNVIACADESSGDSVYAALAKMKAAPFLLRVDPQTIVEYVGKPGDDPVARKASWELGLTEKPEQLRYTIRARLATVDDPSYMDCNPLFNAFLRCTGPDDVEGRARIEELAGKFHFGDELTLRAESGVNYSFAPEPARRSDHGALTTLRFEKLPTQFGVPYVDCTIDLTLDDSGFTRAEAPGGALVEATPSWPADGRDVRDLAARITSDASTPEQKVERLLTWLRPGVNLRYEGRTGSRWGTQKVLEQGFGHCWDFSDAFITLARASGVPARRVAGWLYGSSGHVWAEYWSAERGGWQQVDPTGGGALRAGLYHVPYFTSEDGDMPIVYLSMPTIDAR